MVMSVELWNCGVEMQRAMNDSQVWVIQKMKEEIY